MDAKVGACWLLPLSEGVSRSNYDVFVAEKFKQMRQQTLTTAAIQLDLSGHVCSDV